MKSEWDIFSNKIWLLFLYTSNRKINSLLADIEMERKKVKKKSLAIVKKSAVHFIFYVHLNRFNAFISSDLSISNCNWPQKPSEQMIQVSYTGGVCRCTSWPFHSQCVHRLTWRKTETSTYRNKKWISFAQDIRTGLLGFMRVAKITIHKICSCQFLQLC